MSDTKYTQHFVCTPEEARQLVEEHDHFWVSDCGCRERTGTCSRSRKDVCLQFNGETAASGSHKKEMSLVEVHELLGHAASSRLVPRPFRNDADPMVVDGICFCCDDCCWYFQSREEPCDKGKFIESTDMARCNNCGVCVAECRFGARVVGDDGTLRVARDECYGCGLCPEVCPNGCIEMGPREF